MGRKPDPEVEPLARLMNCSIGWKRGRAPCLRPWKKTSKAKPDACAARLATSACVSENRTQPADRSFRCASPTDASFERQVARIHQARAHVERLTRTLATVPVRKPVEGELDESSGFGVRTRSVPRSPAMHTGIDFRGDSGDPVHATAAGTVVEAGWSGGYGRMVEIDHGSGFSTRYGHLSKIDVKVGQSIKIGQVIGEIGSTGRSTGPHLHYETRIDGEAVNPQKFLRAGEKLGSCIRIRLIRAVHFN